MKRIIQTLLLTLISYFAHASSDTEAETRIGTSILVTLIFVIGFAIVNWVKGKNNKDDQNKPL